MHTSSPFYIARKSRDCPVVNQSDLCTDCNLEKLCLLYGLDKHTFYQFEKCISGKVLLQSGQYLYQQNEPLKNLYWLENGALKNSRVNCEGEEEIDMFYFSGQLIGLDALYSGYYPFDSIASKKSSLYLISFAEFQSLCESNPHLQHNLMKLLTNEINKREHLTLNLNSDPAIRYADFLIDMCDDKCKNDSFPIVIELSISNKDLACYLGLPEKVLEWVIYELEQKGVVALKKQSIVIMDFKSLYQISNSV